MLLVASRKRQEKKRIIHGPTVASLADFFETQRHGMGRFGHGPSALAKFVNWETGFGDVGIASEPMSTGYLLFGDRVCEYWNDR